MWDRTITVSSCGKTFSTTGWKVGYCYGAAELIKPITIANQWIQYLSEQDQHGALRNEAR